MLWLGIGILVIGVALLLLAIVLIKPLFKLAGVLSNLQKTTDTLPNQLKEITSQTTNVLGAGVDTLNEINTQVKKLNPIFNIIGEIGQATNKLSSSIVSKVNGINNRTEAAESISTAKGLEGFYALIALVFLLFKRK
ncbi:DUF948 domain-containing protein [Oceanobacillus sp. FSL K6-0118]|uniref:DUF948 domain-containing protein n=1 Tax=Oceanobacillus sp. FSL K6-0118 TaxID=2921418 RepID=UPI0030FCDE29